MKKIFFIIWADPKFYHTLIFLSQKLSKNNNKVYILQRNVPKNKEIIKKTNLIADGKNKTNNKEIDLFD